MIARRIEQAPGVEAGHDTTATAVVVLWVLVACLALLHLAGLGVAYCLARDARDRADDLRRRIDLLERRAAGHASR